MNSSVSSKLIIYHTNDMHGHHEVLDLIKRTYREPGSILLDSGDALSGSNTVFNLNEPIIKKMNNSGYAAIAMGNREFNYLRWVMNIRSKERSFPLLCANLLDMKSENWHKYGSLAMKEYFSLCAGNYSRTHFDHIRGENLEKLLYSPYWQPYLELDETPERSSAVYIIGATPVQYPVNSLWEKVFGFRFLDPVVVLPYLADVLLREKKNPKVLIILSHLGLELDKVLAHKLPSGTIIVGGHSHTILSKPEEIADCLILQAGSHGNYLGRLEYDLNSLHTSYKLIHS